MWALRVRRRYRSGGATDATHNRNEDIVSVQIIKRGKSSRQQTKEEREALLKRLSRSKYEPHQGKREMARRAAKA